MKELRFSKSFKKLFFSSAIIFVGLFVSRETSESEPGTFHVMNIHTEQQAAMPSSFNSKVRPISPFRLQPLQLSLLITS